MKRFLKEPLLHFLLLGAVLFAGYAYLHGGNGAPGGQRRVYVGDGDVAWLAQTWRRQWQREPTRDELSALVTELVREKVLAREARSLGLDRNDTVVRRRLAQKVEFLVRDTTPSTAPTDDELQRLYAAERERFRTDARVSFTQVFFDRKRADAAGDAKAALARLDQHPDRADAESLGDSLMVDTAFRDVDEKTVAGQLGTDFAHAVFALEPGPWHGPIASAYGLHLVRVSAKQPSRERPFAEVRAQVLARWYAQQEKADEDRRLARLWSRYDVVVDDDVKPLVGSWTELPGQPDTTGDGAIVQ